MKQLFLLINVVIINFSIFSEDLPFSNPDLNTLIRNQRAAGGVHVIRVPESANNRIIGTVDYRSINRNANIYMVYTYERYIVIQFPSPEYSTASYYSIFEFNEELIFSDYRDHGNLILSIPYDFDHAPLGIYDDFLFMVRVGIGVDMLIIDIACGEVIFEGAWTRRGIHILDNDDAIVYKISEVPKITDDWKREWILHMYSFNLKTRVLTNLNESTVILTD